MGKIIVSGKTPNQKRYIKEIQNPENHIIICVGPAGTGKTMIAVGLALQGVVDEKTYDKIVVMRPAREACGEQLGALPGDIDDKMGPWAAPVYDQMSHFIDGSLLRKLAQERKIEVLPLAYARGRSLANSFIIVDEAQNCSPKQMKMVLTRIAENSKMVINGDLMQTDSDFDNHRNGLEDSMIRLDNLQGVGIVKLYEDDIVRHPLIAPILERYNKP